MPDTLPGIDIDGALQNLRCDLPTFRKILLTFYCQRKGNYKEISTLLAQGELEQASDLAHGLMGSSGYLGAWKLHHEAVAMEEACRAGDPEVAMRLLPKFCRCFDEVMAGLGRNDK